MFGSKPLQGRVASEESSRKKYLLPLFGVALTPITLLPRLMVSSLTLTENIYIL